jgi:hypothetical protein
VFVEEELPLTDRWLSQELRNTGIEVGGLAEALPHIIPSAAAVHEGGCGRMRGVFIWVEVQLGTAHTGERCPARRVLRRTGAVGIAHPAQDIPDCVGDREPVEVIGLQTTSSKAVKGCLCKEGQCAPQGLACARVRRYVQGEPVLGQKKCLD